MPDVSQIQNLKAVSRTHCPMRNKKVIAIKDYMKESKRTMQLRMNLYK